jgi:hypothetical protein
LEMAPSTPGHVSCIVRQKARPCTSALSAQSRLFSPTSICRRLCTHARPWARVVMAAAAAPPKQALGIPPAMLAAGGLDPMTQVCQPSLLQSAWAGCCPAHNCTSKAVLCTYRCWRRCRASICRRWKPVQVSNLSKLGPVWNEGSTCLPRRVLPCLSPTARLDMQAIHPPPLLASPQRTHVSAHTCTQPEEQRLAYGGSLASGFLPVNLALPGLRVLCLDPPVMTVDDFVPPSVCEGLIAAAADSGRLAASKAGGHGDAGELGVGIVHAFLEHEHV